MKNLKRYGADYLKYTSHILNVGMIIDIARIVSVFHGIEFSYSDDLFP